MGTRERLVSEKITFETIAGFELNTNFTKSDIVPEVLKQGFKNNTTTQNRVWATLENCVKEGILVSVKDSSYRYVKHKNLYSINSRDSIVDKLMKVTEELKEYDLLRSPNKKVSTPTKNPPSNILFYNTNDINEVHYIINILDIIVNRLKPLSIMYIEKRLKKSKYVEKNPIYSGFIKKILTELVNIKFIEPFPTNLKLYRYTEEGKVNLFKQLNLYREHLTELIPIESSNKNQLHNNITDKIHLVGLLESLEFIRGLPDEKFVVKELLDNVVEEGFTISFQDANAIVAKLDNEKIIRVSTSLNKSVYRVADRGKLLRLIDELKQKEIEKQKLLDKKSNPVINVTLSSTQVGEGMFKLLQDQYIMIDDLKEQRANAFLAIDLLKEENIKLNDRIKRLESKMKDIKPTSTFTPKLVEDNFKKDPLE